MSKLTVSLNEDGLHSIDAPTAFETSEPFDVVLDNDGEAVHVHLNLDETLSTVADIRANNHYVEPEGSRPVGVGINPRTTAVTGRLKIATGYGSEVAYTTVTIQPPEEDPKRVTVDESLAKPQRDPPAEPTTTERIGAALADSGAGLLVAFGLIAVLLAVAIAATLESGVVIAGAVVVLLGVVVAVGLAVRA